MEYDANINRRNEMLGKFRESLSLPMSERYFDAEELIEIFDYAGDMGDDYLRIEVLMCAARYYSDNEDLLERKAIFYSQLSDDARNKYIDDNAKSSGLMWDILRARRQDPQDDKTKISILDDILGKYSTFTEEETIQFVDLASSFGEIFWLKDHLPELRQKATYLNLLLYEVAIAADLCQDLNFSAKMLEELTELEPYNVYFWMMLAKEYASLDESEKALSSIDYALAISPEDTQSLLVRAKLLYTTQRPVDEVIEELRHLLHIDPSNVEAVRFMVSLYSENDNKILAAKTLSDFIIAYPKEGIALIPDLIIYRPNNISHLLDRFFENNEENSQIVWASWAHQLAHNGYADVANEVLEAYHRNTGSKIYTLFPIENNFIQQRFEDVVNGLSEYLEGSEENSEIDFPSMVIMHLMSMIKLEDYDRAYTFCIFLENNCNIGRFQSISGRLEFFGLMKIVKQIKTRLKRTNDPKDWANYDPLSFWS